MNKKDVYKGTNPIYESMLSGITEAGKPAKADQSKSDLYTAVTTAMNTLFTIILNSKMENAKTERGFQEIKNKIIGSTDVGSMAQYVMNLLKSLAALDKAQSIVYQQNLEFMSELFAKSETELNDPKKFEEVKKTLIGKLLNDFQQDLKQRESQLKKTNPELLNQVVKQGLAVKEGKGEEEEFRGKAFNKSKESLDAANSFVGMISRDQYTAVLKDNSDIKRYQGIAEDLYKKAQDLQMLDRKGLTTIVTSSGSFKRGDYMRNQDSLINEIIRQKREYQRIKDNILKAGGLTPPPIIPPICPPGKIYDPAKGICVTVQKETQSEVKDDSDKKKKKTTTPVPSTTCTFPIKVGSKKCSQVKEVQEKIISTFPSVNQYLSTRGGADGKYGAGTSLVCNIVYAYQNKKNEDASFKLDVSGDLTEDMYKSLLEVKASTRTVDSYNYMSSGEKMLEMEDVKSTPVLKFEDFFSVLKESLDAKVLEQASTTALSSVFDDCIKKSIDSKTLDACGGKKKEEEKKPEDTTVPPTREEWKGLKYVKDGTYPVSFDESLLSYWTKEVAITAASLLLPGSGYLAKAGSTGARALAVKGATEVGAKSLATRLAGKGLSPAMKTAYYWGRFKKIPIPTRVKAGILGSTLGGAAADFFAGRDSFQVSVLEGYIERPVVLGIAKGLVNTLDGYVSDDDFACVAQILSIVKGAWTIDDDGNPVSAWGAIKEFYQTAEGEDLTADILSVSAKFGDVEGFPRLKSPNPLSAVTDVDWDIAVQEVENFVAKIDQNEPTLAENIKKLPKDYVKAFEEGEFITYDEIEKKEEGSEGGERTTSTEKEVKF